MRTRFSPHFLLALARSIIAAYETGPEIARFFRSLGYDISFGNRPIATATESMLEDIAVQENGYTRIIQVSERLLNPDHYVCSAQKMNAIADHINKSLEGTKFTFTREDGTYKLIFTGTSIHAADTKEAQSVQVKAGTFSSAIDTALSTVDHDPSGSIARACLELEDITKAILDNMGKPHPHSDSLQSLIPAVLKELHIVPDPHADTEINRIIRGLLYAISGITSLKTHYEHAQSVGSSQMSLTPAYARLGIHAVETIGLCLIEAFEEKVTTL